MAAYKAGLNGGTIELEADDTSVTLVQDGANPKGDKKVKVKKTFDFSSDGDITIDFTPATGAKVSPKQKITAVLTITDTDLMKVTGAANWDPPFTPIGFPGNYIVKITLAHATFGNGEDTDKFEAEPYGVGTTISGQPSYAYVFRGNKIITIDKDWDGKEPVKIEVEVTDRMEIPTDKYPLKPGITKTAIQDKKTIATFEWTKASGFPLWLKRTAQDPGAVGSYQNAKAINCTQLGGPKEAPAYEGLTVDEVFPSWKTNLEKAWLNEKLFMAHPNVITTTDWQKYFGIMPLTNQAYRVIISA